MKKLPVVLTIVFLLGLGNLAWAAPEGETASRSLTVIPSFAPIAEKAEASVVNISTVKLVKGKNRLDRNRSFRSPGDDLFDEFFGGPRSDRKERSLGSGFIFDKEGYIVTNNHVVEGADEIKVKLTSGEEIEAEIIGRDPKTDLALIKLKKKGEYPFLALGDSSSIKIGDWVVAIGNPFGLDHTVTAGILSARSRAIGAGPYDDFLQTDASINPGNSGGPLLNLEGDVIGINTAIVAGGTGIGFAIPANLAKGVIEQLKNKGRVVRGWMGVVIQKVTPEMAKSFGLTEERGALIGDVDPTGPALKAGLKRGDVVVSFDGKPIKDWQDLPITVASTEVGKKVKVVVIRDKKEITCNLVVAEMKEDASVDGRDLSGGDLDLGLTLREITPEIAARMELADREGLYIAGIEPGSLAADSGLNAGDVLVEVDHQAIKKIDDYQKAVKTKKAGDTVLFLVKRGGNTMFFTVAVE